MEGDRGDLCAGFEFMGGARGAKALEDRVRSGAAAVAFSMFPVSVADLMAVSDAGDMVILSCLQQNRAKISQACQKVLKDNGV